MKSYYDRKPAKLAEVKQGVFRYRWNMSEETVEHGEGAEPGKQWSCEEADFAGPVTANRITQAAIAAKWPADYEQKLINEWNAVQLGVADGEEAEAKAAAYRQFLEERAALKAQIDADCAELGIIGQ